MFHKLLSAAWIVSILVFVRPVAAQHSSAVELRITDHAGFAASGACVRFVSTDRDFERFATAGPSAVVEFVLPSGGYDLTVGSLGFREINRHIDLEDSQAEILAVRLEPFACSQCIEVTAGNEMLHLWLSGGSLPTPVTYQVAGQPVWPTWGNPCIACGCYFRE